VSENAILIETRGRRLTAKFEQLRSRETFGVRSDGTIR